MTSQPPLTFTLHRSLIGYTAGYLSGCGEIDLSVDLEEAAEAAWDRWERGELEIEVTLPRRTWMSIYRTLKNNVPASNNARVLSLWGGALTMLGDLLRANQEAQP